MLGYSKKDWVLFVTFMALILLVSSQFFPWWTYHSEESGGEGREENEHFGLRGLEYDSTSSDASFDYDDDDCPYTEVTEVFYKSSILSSLAIVFCLVLLGAILARRLKIKELDPSHIRFIALLAIVTALLAPLYLNAALPMTWEDEYDRREQIDYPYRYKFDEDEYPLFTSKFRGDFDTTEKFGYQKRSDWGGGMGWNLAFFGFLLLIVSLALMLRWKAEVFDLPLAVSPYESAEELH